MAVVHQGEAIIPAGENRASGVTVINQFSITAVDPDGTRKVVRDLMIPEIKKSLQNNTGGSREAMNDALGTWR